MPLHVSWYDTEKPLMRGAARYRFVTLHGMTADLAACQLSDIWLQAKGYPADSFITVMPHGRSAGLLLLSL